MTRYRNGATSCLPRLAFLTRLPVRAPRTWDAGTLSRALRLSPAVGAFVGAFAGSFYWLAVSFGFSTFIAAAAWRLWRPPLLTGGLHEDALSDMADGISGGWTRAIASWKSCPMAGSARMARWR